MTNYLLKFEHSNGSNVWYATRLLLTVYCDILYIWACAAAIEKRTSFKFLDDYTDLGSMHE